MADPFVEKFLRQAGEAAAKSESQREAQAKPKQPARATTPKPASAPVAVEQTLPSVEPVTPESAEGKAATQFREDLLTELPLDEFYKAAARMGTVAPGLVARSLQSKVPRDQFLRQASAQGVDLDDLVKKAASGVSFDDYRKSRADTIGFQPLAEREATMARVADDFDTASRGEAPRRPFQIQEAKETTTVIPGFGEGYEVGGTTADEVLDTTKPGEHQYAIAAQFVDAFEKANPSVVHLTDMYSQNAGPGASQRWIQKYMKEKMAERGLTPETPNADAELSKLRNEAVYYILSKKTIGEWMPGVFVKDVQITDPNLAKPLGHGDAGSLAAVAAPSAFLRAAAAGEPVAGLRAAKELAGAALSQAGSSTRDLFATLSPNVEIVGFNNKGQAVVRRESPAGVTMRALDVIGISPFAVKGLKIPVPGQSLVAGALSREEGESLTEAAYRGAQTGASFVDTALEATRDQPNWVKAAAGLASLAPTMAYPDVTGIAETAATGIKAARTAAQNRRMAKEAEPLLRALSEAYRDHNFKAAESIEKSIRDNPVLSRGAHGVMQAQTRLDEEMIKKIVAVDPTIPSLNPNLLDDIVTLSNKHTPSIYREMGEGLPYMHFSRKGTELAQVGDKGEVGASLASYLGAGNFERHLERIGRAREAYLKVVPKTKDEALRQVVDGFVERQRDLADAALTAGLKPEVAERHRKLADLVQASRADLLKDPTAWAAEDGAFRSALRADPVLGADTDDARKFRAQVYASEAPGLVKRVNTLNTKDFDEVLRRDLNVFDRAEAAVDANIRSRAMSAEILRRQLAAEAKIQITPVEILDDLMEPGTERLSPRATARFIQTMQGLAKEQDRKAWLGAFQAMDAQLRGAAALKGQNVDDYWRALDIRVRDGKPEFLLNTEDVAATIASKVEPGFADLKTVDEVVARLRAAIAGTDPLIKVRSVTDDVGEVIGGELTAGDVNITARRLAGGADKDLDVADLGTYQVEVVVGQRTVGKFRAEPDADLKEALEDGLREAEKAMNLRVDAEGVAARGVVVPMPEATPAARAAAVDPKVAAAESRAVDAQAKKIVAAAPSHPDAEAMIAALDPSVKASPEAVSAILSKVDTLKPGAKYLTVPPKGSNKVLLGAVREELVKTGVLAKLEDGSVVKAGTPEARMAEEAKAAPAVEETVVEAPKAAEPIVEATKVEPAVPVPTPAPVAQAPVRVAPAQANVARREQDVAQAEAKIAPAQAKAKGAVEKVKRTTADLGAAQQELARAREASRIAEQKMFALGEKDAARQAVQDAASKAELARQADVAARADLAKAKAELDASTEGLGRAKAKVSEAREGARLAARTPGQVVEDALKGQSVVVAPNGDLLVGRVTQGPNGESLIEGAQRYAKGNLEGPEDFYRALARDAQDPDFGLGGGWDVAGAQSLPAGAEVRPLNLERVKAAAEAPSARRVATAAPAAAETVAEAQKAEPVFQRVAEEAPAEPMFQRAPEPEVARAVEEAPAPPEVAKTEEAAAPAQPVSNMPAPTAPVVAEEIPAVAAKAEPTAAELQATVDKLSPLRTSAIKRTNVTKTGFDVEVAGQAVRVERRGDVWVDAATGETLGDNVTEAVESLRTRNVLKPLTQAEDALRQLGASGTRAAELGSVDEALAGVKKLRTSKDAELFFGTVRALTLDPSEKARVYDSLAQKLGVMAEQARGERAAEDLRRLSMRADQAAEELRPRSVAPPTSQQAAEGALTDAQRHAQAVTRMRSLTHRADIPGYVVYGVLENDRFVPAAFLTAQEATSPSAVRAALYDQLGASEDALAAARREATSLLEGQEPEMRAFPANKYANDADLEFGSEARMYPSIGDADMGTPATRRAGRAHREKMRQAEILLGDLYGKRVAMEWEEVPDQFRVNASQRLSKAQVQLANGKLTQDAFETIVRQVSDELEAKKLVARARAETADVQRGADILRAKLLQAKAEGAISAEGADLAEWFVRQNPHVAESGGRVVGVVVGGREHVARRLATSVGARTAGFYRDADDVVALIKGGGNELTAVHEVLHRTEQMLPRELQDAIRKEWTKQLTAAIATASEKDKPYLTAFLTRSSDDQKLIREAFNLGNLDVARYYQLANPSEFWAVNASRIVSGRYAAFNAGMIAKAKQWLVEFAAKAKSLFGLASDAPIIRGLDNVIEGKGTFVSEMLTEGVDYLQVGAEPGGQQVIKGRFTAGTGVGPGSRASLIELAAKTADPTTLLHEGAHFIRKVVLDAEDMDNVVAWLRSMGLSDIKHEFGEFIGSADDVELAEEMFATAFEKYVVTGKAPTPALERAFEVVKSAFAGAYRWMSGDAAKQVYGEDPLSPDVKKVFDRYFNAAPKTPVESTLDRIVREMSSKKTTDARGALDILSAEATRKGLSKASTDELVKRIADLKLADDAPGDTVLLSFPEAPILGKNDWTRDDILGLQGEILRRRNSMDTADIRQALFGNPEEVKPTEAIYAALAEREEGAFKSVLRGTARTMAKLVIGGDIVTERGVRELPEVLRRDLDTPARIIEQTIGDSITVLMESTRHDDPDFMYRYLAGETLTYRSGRRVISSGHEYIDGFFDLYRNQYAAMTLEEQAMLQEFAKAARTVADPENPGNAQTISEALERLPTNLTERQLAKMKGAKDIQAYTKTRATKILETAKKFVELGNSGDGSVGSQLRNALRVAAGEGSEIAFNEYRFTESLLYLAGCTPRNGALFEPTTKEGLLEQVKTLLGDAQHIYGRPDDQIFSRRLAVLVAAYGSSKRAKAELAALGATLTREEANAFKRWTLGYTVSPEMAADLELVKGKFGLNTSFINETILGADVYVPRAARERMVEALSKAQFNNAKLSKLGDLYQMTWTYMKKRMTRGAFVGKQRYFFVNTIDHFNQMYLTVGFAPSAVSFSRLLLQGLPIAPFGSIAGAGLAAATGLASVPTGALAGLTIPMIGRALGRAGIIDPTMMEKFRDLLSKGGTEIAQRLPEWFSAVKYRVEVNDVLEGRNKLIVLGGNVYTGRQLRDMFIAEGVFSSFDTRRLSTGIRMEGQIFGRELRKISADAKTGGALSTAASKALDWAQDLTVDQVDDMADAWGERERLGAAITLIESGVDPRVACRLTTDALYDYSQSMTQHDRHWALGAMLPFWAFQKNANQQFVNVLFSPGGAYRMMAMQRLREGSATLASELYYSSIGGELGMDVDQMPEEMKSLYYGIMTRAHEVYGDTLPEKVRIGLRIALTGRTNEVVKGKYYELDASLIGLMQQGGLVPGGKFGGVGMSEYMLAAPNKSGLSSYARDRFGMVAPQRRNAMVRHYSALMGGANEDYFYFMLPESSVETAYKHGATLLATGLQLAGGTYTALTPESAGIPGMEVLAGGDQALDLGALIQTLQPIVDLERSPIVGLGISMYAERGYPQRLHPSVAAFVQGSLGMPVLRVPAKMDPFMGGSLPDTDIGFKAKMQVAAGADSIGIAGLYNEETGEPADLIEILGADYVRTVQELNSKDLPADLTQVAKEERFYLPPGFMSLSFENSPLGEYNRELIKWDESNKEKADPVGQAAYFTRILLGTDVVQVSPSRTAQQEEPVRYVKSTEPL